MRQVFYRAGRYLQVMKIADTNKNLEKSYSFSFSDLSKHFAKACLEPSQI